jgi:light-regulated signal transduction histidine kinase (bacteriophytochrome)
MKKSVKSGNRCEIPACRQAGVIQTSYDIIKAHGGEIKVESAEGQGTEFIIQIPVQS